MMLSASPAAIGRSSLEEMLDSLRRRDEEEKPKDLPPALPSRPTSRGRLPPARRSLPTNFGLGDEDRSPEFLPNGGGEDSKRKESDSGAKMSFFGSKKMRRDFLGESPYEEIGEIELEESSDRAESNKNIGYFVKKKLRVWCRLPRGQWELGTIQSTSAEYVEVALSNGNVIKTASSELLPANANILDGVNDLAQLSYLNEPSLLHNLHFRYSKDLIYSKAGPVLVAVNPFKDVQIFGDDFVMAYKEKRLDSPHIYAVLDIAYNEMMRDEVNQSIIISGESGAGKTETAKIVMQYLAALSGGFSGVEKQILQSNFILEAFGNAKTSNNKNSSRFGKLIEIYFTSGGKICGADIQAFLLDKSRVVQVAGRERSYHIFYQLCAGAPKNLKEKLNLKTASEYKYLNQSDCLAIDGVDEAQKFHILTEALDILRISKKDQERLFSMTAAVLWLGNISFQLIDNGNQVEVLSDEAVTNAAKLMGCSTQELMLSLSRHKSDDEKDGIAKKWTLQQASERRDALAKFIYVSLFDWLVEQLNKSLQVGAQFFWKSISVLDIYGFETFQTNSFEQMCVNYANERLQQHFNRHLLKLEQEGYEQEGIDWTKVDFADNLECLDLFEKKSSGLISVLDEESNFPKASDLTFANKLKQHLGLNSFFKGERGRAFSVRHHAGEVLYDTNGFLEKNKDSLHIDFLQLLSSSHNELLQSFAANTQSKIDSLDSQTQSVATTFKLLLFKLMRRLESTRPHFICCIKPNNKQLPGMYEEYLVAKQLRCFGVLEIVKISRMGYPTRMEHQEFSGRYGLLLPKGSIAQDPLSVSIALLQQLGLHPETYRIGYTKVFLQSGQIEILEQRRRQFLQGIVGVQKYFRGHQARRRFNELSKKGAKTLQSCFTNEVTRSKNNISINWRTASAPKTHDELQAVIYIQSVIRGLLVRKQLNGTHGPKILTPNSEKYRRNTGRKMSDFMIDALPSSVKELQQRVLKAEETVELKEEENAALREQLQQVETRWSEYELKMKSMEELWQKQMGSLQMSLAAARKSLVDTPNCQPGRADGVTSPRYYDSDATSMGSRTPGASTPLKNSNSVGVGRDTNGTLNAVSNLIREFEQQRQTFDDDAKALAEANNRPGLPISKSSPDSELRKLKLRFEMWKKEYKARLRETKAKVHKLGLSDGRRKWWERITS